MHIFHPKLKQNIKHSFSRAGATVEGQKPSFTTLSMLPDLGQPRETLFCLILPTLPKGKSRPDIEASTPKKRIGVITPHPLL